MKDLNDECVLITGGCGFVGSSLAIRLKENYPRITIKVIDNLKRRGSELNYQILKEKNIEFFHGDIRIKEDFDQVGEISILIDAAAEPSVLSGIHSSPDYVINTNLVGTLNCLNYAVKNKAKFLFLSTSRVYPISKLNKINYFEESSRFSIAPDQSLKGISQLGLSEEFSLDGARSFYGASKYASEILIHEFNEFYNLKTIINRCGVLTGPYQMGKVDQGVVVLWMARHFWKGELNYIGYGGEGKQVRDILHINDLFNLIILQLSDFEKYNGQMFNVGGGREISISLKELSKYCEEITGNKIKINKVITTREADIPIYLTDNSKIKHLSGWEPKKSTKEILTDIYDWMLKEQNNIKSYLN